MTRYIFNDKIIPKLVNEYSKYQLSKNSEIIEKRDLLKKRITDITAKIDNLINLAARVTTSEALASKLTAFENEKIEAEVEYEKVCFDNDIKDITVEELTESFINAKRLLAKGDLLDIKKLIQLYVDNVTIYEDHVDVRFKFHPDLVLPELDESPNIKKKLYVGIA